MSRLTSYELKLTCEELPLQGVEPLTARELLDELKAFEENGVDLSLVVTPVLELGPVLTNARRRPVLAMTVLSKPETPES